MSFVSGLGLECPCGRDTTMVECCGPVIVGERLAVTATELMRSRYVAFAVGDVGHLVRSWHPRTRPERIELDDTSWLALDVVDAVDGGPGDSTGIVEFTAHWSRGGVTGARHERSRFERRAGRWLYLDGDLAPGTGRHQHVRADTGQQHRAPDPLGDGRAVRAAVRPAFPRNAT